MKVLQVIHDFLPNHQAGSELYCYHLSKSLQARGHDVRLCFTEIDHGRPQYSTRIGEHDGLPFWEIVNNHSYASFEETYSNPNIEKIFAERLGEFQPDVVHFHHLLALSFGCVRLCKERGIPVFFTLHDYWITCPRGGGQRFRGEGKVCHTVDPNLCAECISRFSFPARAGQRIVKALLNRVDHSGDPTLISAMMRGAIQTPNRDFVTQGHCDIHGDHRKAVFAHPPATIRLGLSIPENAALNFGYAMAPTTYQEQGNGVRFRVLINGDAVFDQTLHPKTNAKDQGWHNASAPLDAYAGQNVDVAFQTIADPDEANDFCSACWGEPRIALAGDQEYRPTPRSRIISSAEWFLTALQKRGLKKRVEKRREAALALFQEVDCFIAPSRFLRDTFIDYGMPPERIVFSDYGIAPLSESVAPRKPRRPIQFAFVGTLVAHKGLHVLIEAFNRIPHGLAELNVYGALNEFQGYVSRIRSMIAHPGIHLRGRAENHEIASILGETDALIVPSIWFENSPITIHEAFLARVPVITSRFGGMADLVQDGKNGLLFEMGDADDLRRCLMRLADAPQLIEELRPDPTSVTSLEADGQWMEEQYRSAIKKTMPT